MLRKVVSAQGTGDAATVKGYSVAGKTGTAQVIGSNGQYSNSLFMSSFAGYVPANHPQLVIVVTVDEPGDRHLRRYRGGPGVQPDRVDGADPAGHPPGMSRQASAARRPCG